MSVKRPKIPVLENGSATTNGIFSTFWVSKIVTKKVQNTQKHVFCAKMTKKRVFWRKLTFFDVFGNKQVLQKRQKRLKTRKMTGQGCQKHVFGTFGHFWKSKMVPKRWFLGCFWSFLAFFDHFYENSKVVDEKSAKNDIQNSQNVIFGIWKTPM